jgi:hypothetical protein
MRAGRSAFALILGVSLAAPVPAFARSLRELVEGAEAARDRGRLEEALHLLEEAYHLEPSPALLNNMGQLLEGLGRYREAYESYRRVARSPEAEKPLRALDTAREAALMPRLTRAWVLALPQVQHSLRFDGMFANQELELEPERPVAIESHGDGSPETVLRWVSFPTGVRTTLAAELPIRGEDARLVVASRENRLLELSINGYALRSAPAIESVVLDRGHYDLRLEYEHGQGPISTSLELSPGETRTLAGAQRAAPGPASPAIAFEATAPPPPARSLWPFATLALGAATGASGGVLFALAATDRNRLHEDCPRSTMTCSIARQPAYDLQTTANTMSVVGAILVSVGAAALIGGGVGWLTGS